MVLERIRTGLKIVLAGLGVVLAAAIVLGVLDRPVPELSFPAAAGTVITEVRGSGSRVGRVLPLPQHRVGVLITCRGVGRVEVVIGGAGWADGICRSGVPSSTGYVLSGLAGTSYRWRVRSPEGTRWAVAFTQPRVDGVDLTP